MIQKIIQFFIPLLYIFSVFTVIATAHMTGYSDFLKLMTQENSVFEILTILWLFGIFFYGATSLYSFKNRLKKLPFILISLLTLLTFFAAMEEISWGQHLFHFQSTDFFIQHNRQKETNLHNLMDANLFSSLIYVSIYILLVFIPLSYKTILKQPKYLKYFDINMHYILIILFSSTFQLYFYNDFGVRMDMIAHFTALAFFLYVLTKVKKSFLLKIHYSFIVLITLLFMSQYQVFGFFNMQYEIREMFVSLAVFLMLIEFIQKERRRKI